MTYDEFREAWLLALRESRLQIFGVDALQESLALRAMDRIGESIRRALPSGRSVHRVREVPVALGRIRPTWRWRCCSSNSSRFSL